MSYYTLKIEGKDVNRFFKSLIKQGIHFINVNIDNKILYITINKDNYEKIKKIKTTYTITLIEVKGYSKIKKIVKDNIYMIISLILGLFLLLLLSSITFKVEIMHEDSTIKTLLEDSLKRLGIKKYNFLKSYDEIQKIKEEIIENNKDKIQWLEIEKNGCVYTIRVDKRTIRNIKTNDTPRNIIAKKSGIIMNINASKGEVVTKVNDYVKKGDILISGEIHRNDEVKGTVRADGTIYAEVWYKVEIETPINYKEEIKTNNTQKVINISFFGNNFNIFDFNNYKNKKLENTTLINDFFGLFKISLNKEKEMIYKDTIYDITTDEFSILEARRKIEENLKDKEYVISQKKLKTIINNSTMVTEVFFKVYEDITDYSDILERKEKEGE